MALVGFAVVENGKTGMAVAEGAFGEMLPLHRQTRLPGDHVQQVQLILYPLEIVGQEGKCLPFCPINMSGSWVWPSAFLLVAFFLMPSPSITRLLSSPEIW